jgi:hypothetical protein
MVTHKVPVELLHTFDFLSSLGPSININRTRYVHKNLSDLTSALLSEKVSGYVLIANAALEYSSAQKALADASVSKSIVEFDTERLDHHTPASFGGERFHHWGSPLVCRAVIKDHGDVVEVSTLDSDGDPERPGHGIRGADYIYELKTFVRKADLVPVLGSTYQNLFEDNTMIRLDPGVAVGIPWGADLTQRAISVQQLHFAFSIPDSLLALSYQPKMKVLQQTDEKLMLKADAVLLLNGNKLCRVSEIRDTKLRTPNTYQKSGSYSMVELSNLGIHLTLLTDGILVNPYVPKIDRPVLTKRYDIPPRWYYSIQEGTPVFWEDGKSAGMVMQFFSFQSEIAPGHSTWCEVMPELFKNEQLCFKLSDIEIIDNE